MNLDGVEINVMGHNMIICYGMVWSKLELNGTQQTSMQWVGWDKIVAMGRDTKQIYG